MPEPSEEDIDQFLSDVEEFLHDSSQEIVLAPLLLSPHSMQMLYVGLMMLDHVIENNGLGVEFFDETIHWLEIHKHLDCFTKTVNTLGLTVEELLNMLDAEREEENPNG